MCVITLCHESARRDLPGSSTIPVDALIVGPWMPTTPFIYTVEPESASYQQVCVAYILSVCFISGCRSCPFIRYIDSHSWFRASQIKLVSCASNFMITVSSSRSGGRVVTSYEVPFDVATQSVACPSLGSQCSSSMLVRIG